VYSAKFVSAVITAMCCLSAVAATNDPMRPVSRPGAVQIETKVKVQPSPRRNWVLSSTLVGSARRVAVINDRLVSIGDSVLGAEVIDIGARSARLRYAGQELELQLGGGRESGNQTDAGKRRGAGQ